MSFSANDVSDGGLYERLGFRRDGDVRPDYRYFGRLTGDVRRPKESFQLRRFRDDPALVCEDGWTEARAARENGLSRVWDAGKVRWVLDVTAPADGARARATGAGCSTSSPSRRRA